MAITAVGTPTNDAGNRTTSRTFAHTVNASADALVVTIQWGYEDAAGGDPGSVAMTYAGVDMTQIAGPIRNATFNCGSSIWLLLNPTTGTNNVVCTWVTGKAKLITFIAADKAGVHQTLGSAYGTAATATGTSVSGGTATVDVSSAVGELVIDSVAVRHLASAPPALSVGASQTARTQAGSNPRSAETVLGNEGGHSYEAGAATVTMSWTYPDVTGGSEYWAICGVALKPAATATHYTVTELTISSTAD